MATDKEVKTAVGEETQRINTASAAPTAGRALRGLTFERVYSDPSVSPYDAVEWELRTAAIVSARLGSFPSPSPTPTPPPGSSPQTAP